MEQNGEKQHISRDRQRHIRLVLVLLLGIVVGASVTYAALSFRIAEAPYGETQEDVETVLYARSAPTLLRIPKLALEASFESPLGLNDDGTVEVPDTYTKVGWYKHGATPGEVGPAVILGHVDSVDGPAVFYSLGKLEKGDTVEVTREDGTVATFVVEETVRYAQDDFPTERVYGATEGRALRLVTCTGTFNKGTQRYSHNLVVYATLKESE